jgi:hypothetical protein
MTPPVANLTLGLLGAFLIFVGVGVHPNLIIIAIGLMLSLTAVLFRFEKRPRRRPRG